MIKISASLKENLRIYYKNTDAAIDKNEKARVVAMASKEAAGLSTCDDFDAVPLWRFVVGQLHFVNPLAWLAQVTLLAGMLLIVGAFGASESSMLVVMAAAVLSVAMAIPSVFRSFEDNVAELEASCRYGSAQVLISRFVLFGLADVLWMSIAAWLVPTLTNGDPFRVFLYAATPFFAFCAICFYLSRLTRGNCAKACTVAACCVIVALWVTKSMLPHWYSETSILVWSVTLMVSIVLAIYEARRLVAQIATDNLIRMPYLA